MEFNVSYGTGSNKSYITGMKPLLKKRITKKTSLNMPVLAEVSSTNTAIHSVAAEFFSIWKQITGSMTTLKRFSGPQEPACS